MTRISDLAPMLLAALSLAPGASFARHHAWPDGSDAAKSFAKVSHHKHATSGTALGTGHAKPPPAPNSEATINQENTTIDTRLKSICRGC
jgi:hypothetical protein